MKKLSIALLSAAMILCCVLGLCACGNKDDGGIFKFTLNDDGESYTVVAKENATVSGEITIPDTYNGKPVTVIGRFAFQGKNELNIVHIPEGITKIDVQAFNGCSTLSGYNIPASVKSIGQMSFANCTSLGTINIPDTVTEVGIAAFSGCQAGDLIIGSGIDEIKESTFSYCNYLSAVTIPGTVKRICDGAFTGCQNLSSVTIESGVEVIEPNAFSWCENLSSVTIPETATIEQDLHSGPFSVSPVVVLEAPAAICYDLRLWEYDMLVSVTITGSGKIEDNAFHDCTNLSVVDIVGNVTEIGDYAFSGCNITSLLLPDGLLTIGENAFSISENMQELVLPSSVTSVAKSAFPELQTIYYKGTPAQWEDINFLYYDYETMVAFYSETRPAVFDGSIFYWHYDNDRPVMWMPD
ncbi:MAG: leucine-rich repeat domain-containing protein [Bacteroides sp.]|nr:leucine-rich repeat domain-containing protein [Bacillota bacterium]MCM1393495.1 leucine-rich repeat domain-containing protein [[Eubacterium] siraeum]MCM1455088.1 leucine-rich repeat domain-containing protein [Bacteroides sp.]